ncbi:hypothetical protein BEWA_048260 [Theileria equi strain WA]|uniref:Signal peptide containing protein n=1 Tax=Theileria equi strain WA TaxID=1537102 RepID=L1LAS6_THEEQ|nr:hypothetical protein BEWA_048260 [Theileria equi strain WA]EKX72359.1 hypothetical protein BEWA_048260 [Theileria equi strain WA]|eukprot:XP_004831811.1 hypothetical protein BEWA_048260 [Theileria equi strain WA]
MNIAIMFCFFYLCKFGKSADNSEGESLTKNGGNLRRRNSLSNQSHSSQDSAKGSQPTTPPAVTVPLVQPGENVKQHREPLIPPTPLDGQTVQDAPRLTLVPMTFDIFDVDHERVRSSERTTFGIAQVTYVPVPGFYFKKIEEMGEDIWDSGESNQISTRLTTYGKNGLVSIIEVDVVSNLGDIPEAVYFEKLGNIWEGITSDMFYDKLSAMEEKKKPFKINRNEEPSSPTGKDDRKLDTIDLSNVDENLVDITSSLEGAMSYVKYVPKNKVNIGPIVDGGEVIWAPKDMHMECAFIKIFSRDEMKLMFIYTRHHKFPEYVYFKKIGNSWKHINKDEYDNTFDIMKEMRPIKYVLDLANPEEGKFTVRDEYDDGIKQRVISPKSTFTVTSIVDGERKVWEAGSGEKLKIATYNYKGSSAVLRLILDKYTMETVRFFVKRKSKWMQVLDDTYNRKFREMKRKEAIETPIFPPIILPSHDDEKPSPPKPARTENQKQHFFETVLPEMIEREKEINKGLEPIKDAKVVVDNHPFLIPESVVMEQRKHQSEQKIYHPPKVEDKKPERRSNIDFSAELDRARQEVERRFSVLSSLEITGGETPKIEKQERTINGVVETIFVPKEGKFNKVTENGVDVWIAKNGEACIKVKMYSNGKSKLLHLYNIFGNRVGFKTLKKSGSSWLPVDENKMYEELSRMRGEIVDKKTKPEISGSIFSSPLILVLQFSILFYFINSMD